MPSDRYFGEESSSLRNIAPETRVLRGNDPHAKAEATEQIIFGRYLLIAPTSYLSYDAINTRKPIQSGQVDPFKNAAGAL